MSPSICTIATQTIDLIRAAVPLLASVAVLLFMFSAFQYVRKTATGHRDTDRAGMLWGLVALFVLFSIWGILGFLKVAFFPTDQSGGNTTECGNVKATGTPVGSTVFGSKPIDQTTQPGQTIAPSAQLHGSVTYPAQ